MNEHIPKPADPQRLVETGRPLAGAASEPAMLPGIDMVDALTRLGGNRALLNRVYVDFCQQYADAAAEMGRLIEAGAAAEATALAHAVKGVSGNIGATRVFAVAKALEAELLAGGDGADLLGALRTALGELSRAAPTSAPPVLSAAVGIDREKLGHAAQRLRELLRARDLDAEECLATLKGLCPDGPMREPLARLQAAVEGLDFAAALGYLAQVETAASGLATA